MNEKVEEFDIEQLFRCEIGHAICLIKDGLYLLHRYNLRRLHFSPMILLSFGFELLIKTVIYIKYHISGVKINKNFSREHKLEKHDHLHLFKHLLGIIKKDLFNNTLHIREIVGGLKLLTYYGGSNKYYHIEAILSGRYPIHYHFGEFKKLTTSILIKYNPDKIVKPNEFLCSDTRYASINRQLKESAKQLIILYERFARCLCKLFNSALGEFGKNFYDDVKVFAELADDDLGLKTSIKF